MEKTTEFFIPKFVKKKTRMVQCRHPGCENVFKAYPHARFCSFHKDPSTRLKEKKVEENTFFEFKHSFKEKTLIERECDCCRKPYRIEIYPDRTNYSRFCGEHLSEFKRNNWRESHCEKGNK